MGIHLNMLDCPFHRVRRSLFWGRRDTLVPLPDRELDHLRRGAGNLDCGVGRYRRMALTGWRAAIGMDALLLPEDWTDIL